MGFLKKVGIISNFDKDAGLKVTKTIADFLEQKGADLLMLENMAKPLNMGRYAVSEKELYNESDFLVVLGGDGTILGAGRKAAIYDTPLLGINLGTLGYLTDVEKSGAKTSLEKVLKGDYKIEKRMILEGFISSKGKSGILALNDVCIFRGSFSKIVKLNLFINNEYLYTYRADGVIISTPTGSTAYNLSAGGPILKPDVQMVVITPICPHELNARSIVISADDIVTVQFDREYKGELLIRMDGEQGISLKNSDVVQVKRSKYQTSIIKTNSLGFYDVLRQKLVLKGE